MVKSNTKHKKCANCDKNGIDSCSSCGEGEVCKIQQRIFEREVDEELRQERLEHLWKKYRFLVYGVIIAVLVGTSGYEFYRSWWQKTKLAESDKYENALIDAYAGKSEQAVAQLKTLANAGKTGYRYLARLEMAGILIASGKQEEGISLLNEFIHDSSAPEQLRGVAILSYVGQQVEKGDVSKLQALLSPMIASKNSSFSSSATELSALLYLRENKPEQAKQVIQSALTTNTLSLQMQERLKRLLSEIKE